MHAKRWAGLILTALPVLFLLFDAVIKLMAIGPVVDSFAELGYPVRLARGIGSSNSAVLLYAS